MKYVVAWEHPKTGLVNTSRASFAVKELAEDAVRTLGRLWPQREYWVLSQEDAAALGAAVPARYCPVETDKRIAARPAAPATAGASATKTLRSPVNRRSNLGWRALPAVSPERMTVSPPN